MPSVRINTRQTEGSVLVQVLFSHPMESGRVVDAQGIVIPAWYLTEVSLHLNDEPISLVTLSSLISKNPVLSFELADAQPGDDIKVRWTDSRAKTGERSAKLA